MVARGRDETEPLLSPADSPPGRSTGSKRMLILVVCSIFVLALDFGFFMGTAPQTQIFEQIICRKYQDDLHRTGNIAPGDPCKSEAVQGELALVIGFKDTFEGLPSMSLALPFLVDANTDQVSCFLCPMESSQIIGAANQLWALHYWA